MGGDGGQVIDRATMVKCKGYGLTKERGGGYAASLGEMANFVQMVSEDRGLGVLERHKTRMTQCWLSQETLRDPVVACKLGNLYNKEALIGALLNRSIPEDIQHIRALKDVKPCLISWKERLGLSTSKAAEREEGRRHMVCPVTCEDLDEGSSRAVLIWTTGAVIGAKTLKELKLKECPVTNKPFDPEQDVLPLAATGEELEKLRARLPPPKKRKAAAAADLAAAVGSGPAAEGMEAKARKLNAEKSDVLKSLFISKNTGQARGSVEKSGGLMGGTRDGFGTPAYNRGSNLS
mmetsp:Transcript_81571/g.214128  ORF Transcript_81571/g.214128 Transcript_81571/m.214128 type:complete len:292 (-) Transcript_81571:53-928(-)